MRNEQDDDAEIGFDDVVAFLAEGWRWLLAGCALGLFVGLMASVFSVKNRAEIVLDNTVGNESSRIDFSSYKALIRVYPLLAKQLLDARQAHGDDTQDMEWLASDVWWDKHVKAVLAISKSDTKDLGGVPSNMTDLYTKVLAIPVTYEQRSEEVALQRADLVVSFMRHAGAYLDIKKLLESYSSKVVLEEQSISLGSIENELSLRYLRDDEKAIEEVIRISTDSLNERVVTLNRLLAGSVDHPAGERMTLNIRSGETRDLPLDSKLNDVKLAIRNKEIARERFQDDRKRNELLKQFVQLASSQLGQDAEGPAHGLEQLEKLFEVEQSLRASIADKDIIRQAAIETIRRDLTDIKNRYTYQLPVVSRSVSRKTMLMPALAGGVVAGGFLALGFALFWRRYQLYRQHRAH